MEAGICFAALQMSPLMQGGQSPPLLGMDSFAKVDRWLRLAQHAQE